MVDLPDTKTMCHRTGFTKSCRKLVVGEKCKRWMTIAGANPNTGEPVNKSDCVDNWTPLLMIENSQQQRQTAAAIESFRNEMVEANNKSLAALRDEESQPRLPRHSGN